MPSASDASPAAHDARADGAGRLVAGARRDRHALQAPRARDVRAQPPGRLGALEERAASPLRRAHRRPASRATSDRLATSSHSVPEASEQSVAASPVICSRSQSFGSSTRRVRAKTSASWARTQSSFGAVKPGIARLPVIARDAGTARSSAAHSATLRPSFHSIAGRSTASLASSSVAPCIWPESPTARTARQAAGIARPQHRDGGLRRAPPRRRILLGPVGLRALDVESRAPAGDDAIAIIDQHGLHAGRAEIDSERGGRGRHDPVYQSRDHSGKRLVATAGLVDCGAEGDRS